MKRVEVREFLLDNKEIPIVDVRSPGEFEEGHIPNAKNIPLFSDEERAKVGTTYTKTGKSEAVELGLEIAGPKMSSISKAAKTMSIHGKIKTHCWRGGMRSEKMAWLFELVGLEAIVLEGGYKAYRHQLLEDFKNLQNLIVLQGPTGSGKTVILSELKKMGEQILDLEYRANHRGSAFGALGMGEQPSTTQFQNQLYEDLLDLDQSKRIWIESESLSIGKVYLPETLWENMNTSDVIELQIEKSIRAQRVVEDYGHFPKEYLVESINKIKNRFGGNRVKEALALLDVGDLEKVALLLLDYYDKAYSYSRDKYKKKEVATYTSNSGDPTQNAIELVNIANQLQL